jgi:hypothetical protein
MPYFEPSESACVVDATDNKTLQTFIEDTLKEGLERRMKKRVESEDYRICTAHDLAPIFEKVFDINPKDLQRDSELLALFGPLTIEAQR